MAELEHKVTYREDGKTVWFEEWRLNGQRHRTDGPAAIQYHKDGKTVWYETWYLNGQLHRIDGPARVCYEEDGKTAYFEEWRLEGNEIKVNKDSVQSKKRWNKLVAEWVFENMIELPAA